MPQQYDHTIRSTAESGKLIRKAAAVYRGTFGVLMAASLVFGAIPSIIAYFIREYTFGKYGVDIEAIFGELRNLVQSADVSLAAESARLLQPLSDAAGPIFATILLIACFITPVALAVYTGAVFGKLRGEKVTAAGCFKRAFAAYKAIFVSNFFGLLGRVVFYLLVAIIYMTAALFLMLLISVAPVIAVPMLMVLIAVFAVLLAAAECTIGMIIPVVFAEKLSGAAAFRRAFRVAGYRFAKNGLTFLICILPVLLLNFAAGYLLSLAAIGSAAIETIAASLVGALFGPFATIFSLLIYASTRKDFENWDIENEGGTD